MGMFSILQDHAGSHDSFTFSEAGSHILHITSLSANQMVVCLSYAATIVFSWDYTWASGTQQCCFNKPSQWEIYQQAFEKNLGVHTIPYSSLVHVVMSLSSQPMNHQLSKIKLWVTRYCSGSIEYPGNSPGSRFVSAVYILS